MFLRQVMRAARLEGRLRAARLAGRCANSGSHRLAGCTVAAISSGTAIYSFAQSDSAPTNQRLKEGGVLGEYKERPRTIKVLQPPALGFFSKEVDVLGVPIRAHAVVSDAALTVAADRLSRMLRHMPEQVTERLARRRASFHIIGVGQGTSDLPEHAHMKGVDGGYTGERGITLDQRARGMGGLNSSCGEENLVDLDSDPRYAGRDILTHEFAHCIMDVGLPPSLRAEIRETHARAVKSGRWRRADGSTAYAGSNASEYFAELTMWYFGTHGEFVDRKAKTPTPGPGGLAEHDPEGFRLLASIYGGTHSALREADPPVRRLRPAPKLAVRQSSNEEEADSNEVALEFDNRGCDCSWKLFWLTPEGERIQYGVVPKGAAHMQVTFRGHAWLLERSEDGDGSKPASNAMPQESAALSQEAELRYVAGNEAGVALVKEDAGCRSR